MPIKTIFFDFDGVIADSLDVKSNAFYKMYEPYSKEIAEKVVQHHLENGGMSRFEKFKIYHQIYLNEIISEVKVNELADMFSELVVSEVIKSRFVDGIEEFLSTNHNHFNCYIITGTPTAEMKIIASAKGIEKYFKGIYGSPENKDYWVKFLLSSENLLYDECVFIGDALSDYKAAITNGITFILREHSHNGVLFSDKDVIRIKNFENLTSILKSFQ